MIVNTDMSTAPVGAVLFLCLDEFDKMKAYALQESCLEIGGGNGMSGKIQIMVVILEIYRKNVTFCILL